MSQPILHIQTPAFYSDQNGLHHCLRYQLERVLIYPIAMELESIQASVHSCVVSCSDVMGQAKDMSNRTSFNSQLSVMS